VLNFGNVDIFKERDPEQLLCHANHNLLAKDKQ